MTTCELWKMYEITSQHDIVIKTAIKIGSAAGSMHSFINRSFI